MARLQPIKVRVMEARESRGWTQQQLADRAGLSRTGVGAIENGRLVPSTTAALALADALKVRVEDLFILTGHDRDDVPRWAWTPAHVTARYWSAHLGGRLIRYPVEPTPAGTIPHDGVTRSGDLPARADIVERTLIVAGCDPAAGLLAAEAARQEGLRIIPLSRGSGDALKLLGEGLVHVAGVHLGASQRGANAQVVRQRLGPGFSLLNVTSWDEGIALDPGRRITSMRGAMRTRLRWIGREAGSGARQCMDELLGDRHAVRHIARDHRGVAEAIRLGYADAGICLRLVTVESGIGFVPIRAEPYDLCFCASMSDDWRFTALRRVVQSPDYRRLLSDLPGYDTRRTGSLRQV